MENEPIQEPKEPENPDEREEKKASITELTDDEREALYKDSKEDYQYPWQEINNK